MSEQRFTIQESSGMYLHLPIFDNGVEMADGDVCILLNKQQATIKKQESLIRKLSEKLEECGLVKINGDIVEWIDNNDENMVIDDE